MSTLPRISGRDAVRALTKIGYEKDRQKGRHIVLRHIKSPHRRIVIPDHREIAKGTLCSIIRELGLTVKEFTELL